MAGKVLFVIERFYGGGAERALSNIVTHFPREWQIDILVDDESMVKYPYRGNLLSLSYPEKDSTIHFIMSMIKRTICLRKIKRDNKYDACISFLEGANISNILSGNKYCKIIVSIRNQVMPEHSGTYHKVRDFLLTKLMFAHADIVTAVSEEIAMRLIYQLKIPQNKVCAIVNGYDCEWIKRNMTQLPENHIAYNEFVGKKYKIVVTVGRLVLQKGQWHLIRAFSEVLKREPQAVLFIIGEGFLKEYLEELAQSYGIWKQVVFVGCTDNPFWFLGIADIFILSSLWEGYPNALAEAICCGLPCIAADVHSGPREILAPGLNATGKRVSEIMEAEYGMLIPVCSGKKYSVHDPLEPEECKMAEGIITLLCDDAKKQYYKDKSMKRGKELDINRAVKEWIDII